MINLLVSLATVTFSFLFRTRQIPVEQVGTHWPSLLNILAGSLVGSAEAPFIAWMATGSVVGAYAGSWLLRLVSSPFLNVALGVILLISAVKMLRHREPGAPTTPTTG